MAIMETCSDIKYLTFSQIILHIHMVRQLLSHIKHFKYKYLCSGFCKSVLIMLVPILYLIILYLP